MSLSENQARLRLLFKELKLSLRKKGGFGRNLATVFSGNLIGQVIGVLLMPIISRLYPPEAYGVFATFSALSANLVVFSSLLYSQTLVLPKEEKSFTALLQLSLLLIGSFTLLVTITLLLCKSWLFAWLELERLESYWYLLPLSVLLTGLLQLIGGWNIRYKQFQQAAFISVLRVLSGKSINIAYALIFTGSFVGLLSGDILTVLIALVLGYFISMKGRLQPHLKWQGWGSIKQAAISYRNYPLFMLPGVWINTFAVQIPIILLTLYSTPVIVGLFAFGSRILSLPLSVIENAVGPVFLQKSTELEQKNAAELRKFTQRSIFILLSLGALPFAALTVFGDFIFFYVFGPEWEESGQITAYIGIYFIFRLPWGAGGSILRGLRKERFLLRFGILLLIARSSSLVIGLLIIRSHEWAFFLFGLSNALVYLYGLGYLSYIVKLNVVKNVLVSIIIVSTSLMIAYGMRVAIIYLFS